MRALLSPPLDSDASERRMCAPSLMLDAVCRRPCALASSSRWTRHGSALMPAMDSFVTRAVSELLSHSNSGDRSEPGSAMVLCTGPQIPRISAAGSANARSGLLRLTLRLLDGRVSAVAYKRARRKLMEESDALADSNAGGAIVREQLARASRLAQEWLLALTSEDTRRQRVLLRDLTDSVVPVRRSRGEYEAGIYWSHFARNYFGA
jgi:hypothetical protein